MLEDDCQQNNILLQVMAALYLSEAASPTEYPKHWMRAICSSSKQSVQYINLALARSPFC